jgi:translation initiation factor 2B subunit (eIF-2B alpha/beta/delta family)
MRYVMKEICMTGKRFLNFITSRGIPASCLAQRLGCHLSSIKKLKSYDKVPRHYINMLIREFGAYLTGSDLDMLNTA